MLVDELIFYLPSWGYLELGFLINESILQFELSNQALNKYVFFRGIVSENMFENTHWFLTT